MIQGLEYLKNHISLNSNADILKICKRFFLYKNIKIDHLNYIQRNHDGTLFYLCSNHDWLAHYFRMGYPSIGAFEQNQTLESFTCVLWSSLDKEDQILKDSREMLRLEHGITLLDKLPNGIGFYNFASTQYSAMQLNKYVDHLDDLYEFIFYFKETALDLLTQASKFRFIMPDNKNKKLILHSSLGSQAEGDVRYAGKLVVDSKEKIFLTLKEKECVEWYLKGKTSSEIATIMGISKRTVETHIENIKFKFKCSNMVQLGYAVAKAKYQNFGFIPEVCLIEKY